MRVRLALGSFFLCWMMAALLAATGALTRAVEAPAAKIAITSRTPSVHVKKLTGGRVPRPTTATRS